MLGGDAVGRRVTVLSGSGGNGGGGMVVDALIGYSLTGAPRPPISSLIRVANNSGVPILALDASGLDGDRRTPHDPCIWATSALTLALPNEGCCSRGPRFSRRAVPGRHIGSRLRIRPPRHSRRDRLRP